MPEWKKEVDKKKEDLKKLLEELDSDLDPAIVDVVEVSPELPSGGTSHCSVTS